MAEGANMGKLLASVCSEDLFHAHYRSKENSKLTASRVLPLREQARHPVARQPGRKAHPQRRALGV